MYFVINTMSRLEEEMMSKIKRSLDNKIISDIFIVKRKRLRKKDGNWKEYEEKLFPGYIFVETEDPKKIASEIRNIDGFKKLVGMGEIGHMNYIPLTLDEENMINDLIGKEKKTIGISTISIEEGKSVKIISGPLVGYEGKVLKYDLHKRVALVSIPFAGRETTIQLGIDVIRVN